MARWPFWIVSVSVLVVACDPLDANVFAEAPPPPPPPPMPAADVATPTASTASPADAPASPLTAADDAALDPRQSSRSPRSSALLLDDVAQLATLLRATPVSSPDYLALMRRLAEEYVELGQACRRDSENGSSPESRVAALAEVRRKQSSVAERAAIAVYSTLIELAKVRGTDGSLNDVRYFLALEQARAGEVPAATRTASDLLAGSPASAWSARATILLHKLGAEPPPPATIATATPVTPLHAERARACSSTFDCPGADVCEDNRCVDALANVK